MIQDTLRCQCNTVGYLLSILCTRVTHGVSALQPGVFTCFCPCERSQNEPRWRVPRNVRKIRRASRPFSFSPQNILDACHLFAWARHSQPKAPFFTHSVMVLPNTTIVCVEYAFLRRRCSDVRANVQHVHLRGYIACWQFRHASEHLKPQVAHMHRSVHYGAAWRHHRSIECAHRNSSSSAAVGGWRVCYGDKNKTIGCRLRLSNFRLSFTAARHEHREGNLSMPAKITQSLFVSGSILL